MQWLGGLYHARRYPTDKEGVGSTRRNVGRKLGVPMRMYPQIDATQKNKNKVVKHPR